MRRGKANIPKFMDHVALGVPMLVLAIAIYLDKLLKDSSPATVAALSELRGVVVVAIHIAIVFVVTVLGAENGRAEGTREMVDMVLAFERRDI